MPVLNEENIARAICSDKVDGERISPSLFKGENTSVSRLAITPLEDTWALFNGRVSKPPDRRLKMIGEINVGTLGQIGKQHNPETSLTVEPDPQEGYLSHAIIPQKVTRGLANKIIRALTLHHEPGAGR